MSKLLLGILLLTVQNFGQDIIIIQRGKGTPVAPSIIQYYLVSSEGDTLVSSEGDTLITEQLSYNFYENNNIILSNVNDGVSSDLQCWADKRKRIIGINKSISTA